MPRPTQILADDKHKPRGKKSKDGYHDFPRQKKVTEEELGRTELLQHAGPNSSMAAFPKQAA